MGCFILYLGFIILYIWALLSLFMSGNLFLFAFTFVVGGVTLHILSYALKD